MLADNAAVGCAMVTLRVTVQPRASVTRYDQVPAARLLAVVVFCTGMVFHAIVYGAVPPDMEIDALPVFVPKQLTSDWVLNVAASGALGWVMVTLRTAEQPFASVTVQFQVPADKLFA